MDIVFVYITNPSREEAKKIARHLLEKRLIACGNIFPIDSLYWSEKNIIEEKEFVLIAKTKEENYPKVKKEVEILHPYETPCIIKIPVSANEKYSDWIKGVTDL